MQGQNMVTAKDIAQALNVSERAVRARAAKDAWVFEEVRCRGGKRRLYPLGSLPDDARQAFATAMLAETSAPAIPAPAPLSDLTARQRETALARLAFVREIERAAALVGKEKAIRNLLQALEDGSLAPRLAELVRVANDRFGSGAHRGLSRRRLYDWCAKFAEGGEAALAPRHKGKDMHWPEWADAFLAHYQRPQKPAITNAYKDFKAEWPGKAPSIFAVRRWLDKMAMPERESGRVTGNALLKLRPHKRRSTNEFWPTDIYTADGTTFDAEIRHPLHGQPFKPEVTLFIDVATRRCVGLSLGLAESGYVILDALRMACLFGGIPAMLYTDNGSGYCNQLMTAEGSGMMDRLGIEMTHSIPGRPQGKGLMERAVQTVCEPVSKRFATCSHADMDADAAKKVFHITRARKQGESSLLPSWEEFKAAMLARVEEYNAAPHRGLPKVEDQSTGRRRHLSPNEAWEGFLRRGWEPVRVPEAIRDELFMPGLPRQVRNGEIQIFNSTYYADELADFHKEYVEVRYDIWDPSKVYAWTTRGEKICTATLDGNSIPYFPQSRVEAALEKREKAQLARVGKKVAAISPGATIQVTEAPRTVTVVADSLTRQPEAKVPRQGLFRVLVWTFLLKQYARGDFAEFLEIHGLPLRVGKYPAGTDEEEIAALLAALRDIGHDAAGAIPDTMLVEFHEAARGSETPFVAMHNICEKGQSKAILGSTLTTDTQGVGSQALGEIHNEVRLDILRSDARQIAGTITRQLCAPLAYLNDGVTDAALMPVFAFDCNRPEDLAKLAGALPKLVDVMDIPARWAHERAGIPQPEDGEPVLARKNKAATSGESGSCRP